MKNRRDLWDMLHESKKLGGAHANFFAYHVSKFRFKAQLKGKSPVQYRTLSLIG